MPGTSTTRWVTWMSLLGCAGLTDLSFCQVFRKINKSLPTLTLLELQYVSPKLLAVKDLDLAIPGAVRRGLRGKDAR